jgi:hypothetical protein
MGSVKYFFTVGKKKIKTNGQKILCIPAMRSGKESTVVEGYNNIPG